MNKKKKKETSAGKIVFNSERISLDAYDSKSLVFDNPIFPITQDHPELHLTSSSNLLFEDDSVLGITVDDSMLRKDYGLGCITVESNLVQLENSIQVNVPESLSQIDNNIFTETSLNTLITDSPGKITFTPPDNIINPSSGMLKLNEPIEESMVNLGIEASSGVVMQPDSEVYLKATTLDNLNIEHCGSIRLTTEDNLFIKDGMIEIRNELIQNINSNSAMFIVSEENRLQFDYQAENYQSLITTPSSLYIEGTQSLLSSFTLDNIGTKLDITVEQNTALQNGLLTFSDNYASLYKPLEDNNLLISQLPETIVTHTPYEMFLNTELISVVTCEPDSIEHVDDPYKPEINDELNSLLSSLDTGLVSMLEGARAALNSTNPDRVRHFTTSLRELFTHVLHILSPNDEITKWSTDPNHYANNKPTRRARLLYISRAINHDSFTKFLKTDVDSVLSFINLFQGSTHSIKSTLTKKQLDTMLTRMESTLTYLIKTGSIS